LPMIGERIWADPEIPQAILQLMVTREIIASFATL